MAHMGSRRHRRSLVGDLFRWILAGLFTIGMLFGLLGTVVGIVERHAGLIGFYGVWTAVFAALLAGVGFWMHRTSRRVAGPFGARAQLVPPGLARPSAPRHIVIEHPAQSVPHRRPMPPFRTAPPQQPTVSQRPEDRAEGAETTRIERPAPVDSDIYQTTSFRVPEPSVAPESSSGPEQVGPVGPVRSAADAAPADAWPATDTSSAIPVDDPGRPQDEIDWTSKARTVHYWRPDGIPYVNAPNTELGTREDLDRTWDLEVRWIIRDAVLETIAIEGPIEWRQLMAKVVRRFGWVRASEKRLAPVFSTVPEYLIRSTPLGIFVWPADLDPVTWRGFRVTDAADKRPLDTICPEEIVNVMSFLARGGWLPAEDLMRETLATFNQKRLTANATVRLRRCLESAVENGRLEKSDAGYRATS